MVKKYLLGKIVKFIKKWNLLKGGEGVLLAISGGADSVFMTEIFYDLAHIFNVKFECIHVNHGIRGKESDKDEEFVREYCKKKGYFLTVKRIYGIDSKESSIEERARKERYRLFEEVRRKRNLDLIATAHTLDDFIETVIFNLLRGSGISGISGIPPVYGKVIRPILPIERKEIEEYLKLNNIDFVIDSTNLDERFTRNYIRKKLLPLFSNVNESFKKHIFHTGLILREIENWSENKAIFIRGKMIHSSDFAHVYNTKIFDFPNTVFVNLLKYYVSSPTYDEISQFLSLLRKKSGNIVLRNTKIMLGGNELAFLFKEYSQNKVFKKIDDIDVNSVFNYKVSIKKGKASGKMECQIDESFFPFFLRTKRKGDKIGGKKLKDRFISLKIPNWRRHVWPVFEKEGEIFFVPGIFKKENKNGNLKLEVKKYDRERFSIFD